MNTDHESGAAAESVIGQATQGVCKYCRGARLVCENHPDRPWKAESDDPNACGCGAGMPCQECGAIRECNIFPQRTQSFVAPAATAYLALLRMPFGIERHKLQPVLCMLRDYLAQATGRSSEEIQTKFEAEAEGPLT